MKTYRLSLEYDMEMSLVTRFITPLGIVMIMFGMGLSLTHDDFKRVWIQPRAIILGIVLQIIGLPVLGFAFVQLLNLDPMMAVAVMLLSSCPGGAITNLVTFISKGDVALSVSLTSINSIITVFTIPLLTTFSLYHFLGEAAADRVDVMFLCLGILAITIPPISFGMITKVKVPRLAIKSEKWVRKVSLLFLVLLVALGVYRENHLFPENYWQLTFTALAFCLASALTGTVIGGVARLPGKQVLTLAIEVGLHNSAMAIVIAVSFLKIHDLAVFAAFYLVMEYLLSGLLMLVTNLPPQVVSLSRKQSIRENR